MKLTFLGAGAWGTALASHAAATNDVVLWGREPAQLAAIAATRENAAYLPGVTLSERLAVQADFELAVAHAADDPDGIVVVATPVAGLREMTRRLATRSLSDCDMYSSATPCPMCQGALYWARIRRYHNDGTPAAGVAPKLAC